MALDTYSGLKAEIIDELDRDDLTDKVDTFIDLAEAKQRREIRIREMISRSRVSFSGRYLALPTGFLQMKTLRLVLTNSVRQVDEVNLDRMNVIRIEAEGTPRFFALHEEIEFDVSVPDSDPITAEIVFYKALTPLSDSNTTNALLTRAPDIYLWGSLIASAPWLSEDDRLTTWAQLYNDAAAALMLEDRGARHGPALVSRVAGATP